MSKATGSPEEELNSRGEVAAEERDASRLPASEGGSEEVVNSEDIVDRLRAEAEENYDKYLRAVAELENYKKRAVRDRADLIRYAGEPIARDILEVVDNLELALSRHGAIENTEVIRGIQLILDQFLSILERHQIKPESAMGQIFDPQKQEAVAIVPSADKPAGTILEEFKKAFFFKDKLLRPGQVVVASEAVVNGATQGNGGSG